MFIPILSKKATTGSFLKGLNSIGLFELMNSAIQKSYTWSDILTERLKAGRGSAIKGQLRGRMLEDFVEEIIIHRSVARGENVKRRQGP
ncbi:MAG TPA: hypothetical protein PKE06_27135, partial [Flavilitoribacter sp.]|nr:hypothetical protein [Flavilitoribacter sp.]HMQ91480.1 hypothetical protein [Flavilitoribacter sp.]